MIDDLEFRVAKVAYDPGLYGILFVDVHLAGYDHIIIHSIEITRDGEVLCVELPYRQSSANFTKSPSITFLYREHEIQLRKVLEKWLKDNPSFDAILRKKTEE